ncbi:MAG: hypothetical protein H8D37_01150 [Chloroflexi bacterium]|nr:hypothetical protein [Chloroflexota bacterium]
MRANARNTPTTTGYLALTFITLFGLILGGCGAPAAPEPTTAPEAAEAEIIEAPTLPPPPPTPVLSETVGATEVPPTPTPVPIMLDDLAAEIAEEVGVVTTVVETEAEPVIFVFEERHDSVLGQIEIAIMLNRLYTDHNLRHIGLEGHMADEEPLDLAWAHREPYYQPDQIITNREDVMTQTLQEGEIGSAELIGLVYHDVVVDGIDDAGLYAFDPPEEAWDAPDLYLYYIALAGMSDANRITWQALYDAEQYDAAFEFALGSDEFTSEMREKLSDPVDIVSIEEWLTALDELQAQAEAVEADLTEEHAASLEAMGEYFEHVSQRSGAMVAAALDLAAAYPEAPLAMTIGALHTARVVELLTDAGVSFAVIRPLSLAEGDTAGLLSAEAYQRKQQGLSVAPDGWLGSYLDGRRKPPPVVDQERYEIEEMVRELAQELAQEAKFMYHYVESPEELKSFLQGFLDEVLSAIHVRRDTMIH